MSGSARHIAVDLGASGGRVALGGIADGILDFEILHRFPNRAVPVGRHLYWNILELWREIRIGLRLAAQRGSVASIGVTTWGVDYALLDRDMVPVGMVHSYRDARTSGIYDAIGAVMPRAEIYRITGIQFLPINTLPQLVAAKRDAPSAFGRAAHLLMLPDLLNFWLGGVIAGEHSNASTTQLYDPVRRGWSDDLLGTFGLNRAIFPDLVEPGTVLGPLLPEIARDTGLDGAMVVAPATHDTASAIAAIPADEDGTDWAYVSSGTWCLAGIEAPKPILTDAAFAANATNEQGVAGTTRLLKNTSGLFLLQECLRGWGDPPIETVLAEAADAVSGPVFDVADPVFAAQGADMPERIASWYRERAMPAPEGRGAMTLTILHSLADAIARSLADIGRVAGRRPRRIHVVGGGSRIALFNRAIADATGAEVIAGPAEATTSGNLLLQAEALGVIPHGAARAAMRRSVSPTVFVSGAAS